MLNLGRMAIIVLVVLTVIYVCLFLYWRSGARQKLEEDWVFAGRPGDRDEWVGARIGPQSRRISRWLVLLVYVLPLVGLSVFIYVTN